MTTRILAVLVVTFVSACGTRATPPVTASAPPPSAVPESNTEDDYVVGPFVTSFEDGEAGVATYYIVRN